MERLTGGTISSEVEADCAVWTVRSAGYDDKDEAEPELLFVRRDPEGCPTPVPLSMSRTVLDRERWDKAGEDGMDRTLVIGSSIGCRLVD